MYWFEKLNLCEREDCFSSLICNEKNLKNLVDFLMSCHDQALECRILLILGEGVSKGLLHTNKEDHDKVTKIFENIKLSKNLMIIRNSSDKWDATKLLCSTILCRSLGWKTIPEEMKPDFIRIKTFMYETNEVISTCPNLTFITKERYIVLLILE
jgi:hypothetical protein